MFGGLGINLLEYVKKIDLELECRKYAGISRMMQKTLAEYVKDICGLMTPEEEYRNANVLAHTGNHRDARHVVLG